MVGWPHRLNGHEFKQTPGDGDGQGNLMCCSPWCHKESDITERLNNNNKDKAEPREEGDDCSAGFQHGRRGHKPG